MASTPTVLLLCAGVTLLLGRVLGDDSFNLEDALPDGTTLSPTPAKPRNPSGGKGTGDFDITDLLDFDTPSKKQTTTKSPKGMTTTKAPKKGADNDDFSLWDLLTTKPTKAPKPTKKPPKKDASDLGFDFNLEDALGDNDNGKEGQGDSGASNISDKDLEDMLDGGSYNPDDPLPPDDQNQVDLPETTIAGIASAVAAALLGAISSYIAYQKKQLCFKIQGSLNQPYVKGENVEAGTMSEPQAERSLLETQSEKPPADNTNQV
ncbi:CD99 antigen-like protein 2 isoform X2 [Pristis pectinata]|uniref:CD99 antigen-like protein 2 isoform X2 n=1 Tax=Pristis pectinata TaxID=685728 RepID=UPI00223E6377|nr:CD99 antigen-like protein 2 isoform X2 [Pristis pectinata]